jgi:hypothetical protein
MKMIFALMLLLLTTGISSAEVTCDVYSRKTLTVNVPSPKDGKLEDLEFDPWITTIAQKEWVLLQASRSDSFYFALFRDGNHLIYWLTVRKNSFGQTSFSASPNDATGSQGVQFHSSKIAFLNRTITYPGGSRTTNEFGKVFEVTPHFKGWIKVSVKGDDLEGNYRTLHSSEILWK